MLIGFTYDLKSDYIRAGYSDDETAEFDRAETIDGIRSALEAEGHNVFCIGNFYSLCGRVTKGERFDLVFNICEGLYGTGRESQVPCILDAVRIPYTFSDPVVLGVALHKGMTKSIVRYAGIPTVDFMVVKKMNDLNGISFNYPSFVKPIAEGTSKGVTPKSKVNNESELRSICKELLVKYGQDVIIERFLPGREVTVGILGTGECAKPIGVMEIILKDGAEKEGYTFQNKYNWENAIKFKLIDDDLAVKSSEIALDVWNILGCRDAGRVDIRCDDYGEPQFIEVNPLPGLSPNNYSDLPMMWEMSGKKYKDLINAIVKSAIKREYDKWRV